MPTRIKRVPNTPATAPNTKAARRDEGGCMMSSCSGGGWGNLRAGVSRHRPEYQKFVSHAAWSSSWSFSTPRLTGRLRQSRERVRRHRSPETLAHARGSDLVTTRREKTSGIVHRIHQGHQSPRPPMPGPHGRGPHDVDVFEPSLPRLGRSPLKPPHCRAWLYRRFLLTTRGWIFRRALRSTGSRLQTPSMIQVPTKQSDRASVPEHRLHRVLRSSAHEVPGKMQWARRRSAGVVILIFKGSPSTTRHRFA